MKLLSLRFKQTLQTTILKEAGIPEKRLLKKGAYQKAFALFQF